MSLYPNIKDPDFNSKFHKKKEFVIYEKNDNSKIPLDKKTLQLHAHQLLISNFLSTHTPYRKLLLFHAVGTGKTLVAWAASRTFVEEYKKYPKTEATPNVFIVGFTSHLFKTEFTKWVELGFISANDIDNLLDLKEKHGYQSKEYIKERAIIYSRLSDRKYNGYYKFYGYRELFNKLFTSNTVNLDVEETIELKHLLKMIEDKKITVNYELLSEFENSLLICDEVHNTYNTENINNYGLCILYITYFVKSLKTIYMSATPLNNSPTEIIDLMNLLSDDLSEYIEPDKYHKIIEDAGSNALNVMSNMIKKRLTGKVSVFENVNPVKYPKRNIIGEPIDGIGLLKFVKCYASNRYYDEYKKLISYNKMTNKSFLSIHNRLFEDIILPDNINDDNKILEKGDKWSRQYELYFDENDGYSYGNFYNEDNLYNYSPKYYNMLKHLEHTKSKVFIYHNNVHKSGANMIASILRENGYIEMGDVPNDNTKCSICGKYYDEKHVDHNYIPLRYILYTGITQKNTLRELVYVFNDPRNIDGHYHKVLIGSRVISEGVTLNEVNNCYIMSLPINIPRMLQVIGRTTRDSTHINLPSDRQFVNIKLFVNSFTDKQKEDFITYHNLKNITKKQIYTIDEDRYRNKINDFLDIQFLEKTIKENAIDGLIHKSKGYNDGLNYDFIPFNNDRNVKIEYSQVDDFTYIHHGFIDNVLSMALEYIKELLIMNKVIKMEHIISYFKEHDYILQFNSKLVNENYIKYLVNTLMLYNNYDNSFINSTYNINKTIIRIDDYIITVNDINDIYNDIFNYQEAKHEINLLSRVGNIEDDITKMYLSKEKLITKLEDFFNIFEYNIPNNILKRLLEKSNNKIIKAIINRVNSSVKQKADKNYVLGIVDKSHKFKIRNKFFDRGVACSSLKKIHFIDHLKHLLDMEDSDIYHKSNKDLCKLVRDKLLKLEMEDDELRYFLLDL